MDTKTEPRQGLQAQEIGRQGRVPDALKATGYLVSGVSVVLLALAAWPGAEEAGLLPALVGGAGASIVGMSLRWLSHRLDRRRDFGPSR